MVTIVAIKMVWANLKHEWNLLETGFLYWWSSRHHLMGREAADIYLYIYIILYYIIIYYILYIIYLYYILYIMHD